MERKAAAVEKWVRQQQRVVDRVTSRVIDATAARGEGTRGANC
jgi:hypothetical protein